MQNPDTLDKQVQDFYHWAQAIDPHILPLLDDTDSIYERFCLIAERLGLEPPNIESTILFSIAKIKLQWELRQNANRRASF
jgi:hypothetical protein